MNVSNSFTFRTLKHHQPPETGWYEVDLIYWYAEEGVATLFASGSVFVAFTLIRVIHIRRAMIMVKRC